MIDSVLGKTLYIVHLTQTGIGPVSITKDESIKIVFRPCIKIIKMKFELLALSESENRERTLFSFFKKLNAMDSGLRGTFRIDLLSVGTKEWSQKKTNKESTHTQ